MSILIAIAIFGAGWLLCALVFEAGYKILKEYRALKVSKFSLCKIWWLALCAISWASNLRASFVQLPILLAISISHMELCAVQEDIITITDILRHIPIAAINAYQRIKPYFRKP